jgi:hypothetical protein
MLAVIHDTVLKLDPRLLQIASGVVIPLVVGFITKLHAAKGLKSVLNFLLSAIAGGLSVALASDGNVLLSTWAFGIIQTFVTSIVAYYGLWKPTGVAAAVQVKTANVGIGTQVPPEVPEPANAVVDPPPPPRDDILPPPKAKASTRKRGSGGKR